MLVAVDLVVNLLVLSEWVVDSKGTKDLVLVLLDLRGAAIVDVDLVPVLYLVEKDEVEKVEAVGSVKAMFGVSEMSRYVKSYIYLSCYAVCHDSC